MSTKLKRIGITQRVVRLSDRNESRDCLDQRWAQLIFSLGFMPVALTNSITNHEKYIKELKLDGVILSGGEDFYPYVEQQSNRDKLEIFLMSHSIKNSIPIFGICRGMQIINYYCKGTQTKISGHIASRHEVFLTEKLEKIFKKQKVSVNSFHNYAIPNLQLGKKLIPIATINLNDEYYVEAFRHSKYPWVGIMWHPEREKSISKIDKVLIDYVFNKGF